MSLRVGFVVNPIAGMGGRVGLKGTDDVVELARARGAVPRAGERAVAMLDALRDGLGRASRPPEFSWLTCAGAMGAEALRAAGFEDFEIVYKPGEPPSDEDTRRAVRAFLEAGASIVLFCGGDGTARAVCAESRRRVPILGIPAGVKMYSGVFGIGPRRTAEILQGFLEGRLGVADADVLDVDEERFRAGQLDVRLYDSARTPREPALVQCAKQVFSDPDEGRVKAEIAEDLAERMQSEPGTLFLLGPGSTVASVAELSGLPNSLLGVDAVCDGKLVGLDLDEAELLALLEADGTACLVVSPIGAQGFVLGRGNQQLSPAVIRRIGVDHIVVVATPMKLAATRVLRFDTGDPALDRELAGAGYLPILTGYHVRRLVPVEI
jgi:predicted polyphosphate/ATP-dependent NAD kinase